MNDRKEKILAWAKGPSVKELVQRVKTTNDIKLMKDVFDFIKYLPLLIKTKPRLDEQEPQVVIALGMIKADGQADEEYLAITTPWDIAIFKALVCSWETEHVLDDKVDALTEIMDALIKVEDQFQAELKANLETMLPTLVQPMVNLTPVGGWNIETESDGVKQYLDFRGRSRPQLHTALVEEHGEAPARATMRKLSTKFVIENLDQSVLDVSNEVEWEWLKASLRNYYLDGHLDMATICDYHRKASAQIKETGFTPFVPETPELQDHPVKIESPVINLDFNTGADDNTVVHELSPLEEFNTTPNNDPGEILTQHLFKQSVKSVQTNEQPAAQAALRYRQRLNQLLEEYEWATASNETLVIPDVMHYAYCISRLRATKPEDATDEEIIALVERARVSLDLSLAAKRKQEAEELDVKLEVVNSILTNARMALKNIQSGKQLDNQLDELKLAIEQLKK